MKFSCHACGAKYQIADDKLGRKGVKVRCKKCGEMMLLRPEADAASEEATLVGPAPASSDEPSSFDDGPSGSLPSAEDLLGAGTPSPGPTGVEEDPSIPTGSELRGLKDSLQTELSEGLDLDAPAPSPSPSAAPSHASSPTQAASPSDSVSSVPLPASGVPGAAQATPVELGAVDESVIESELGSAFAAMFSPEGIASDRAPPEPEPEPEPEPPAGLAEPTNGHTGPQPSPPGWFVAVGDEQVGPLSFEEVRARWVERVLGPESLCWKPGMPDWMPMRHVPDWAELPEWEARLEASAGPASDDLSFEGMPSFTAPEATGERSATDTSWRPSAASALDSLAAEELAEPEPATPAPAAPAAALGAVPAPAPAAAAAPAAPAAMAATAPAPGPYNPVAGGPLPAGGPGSASVPASGVAPVLPTEVKPQGRSRGLWVALLGLLAVGLVGATAWFGLPAGLVGGAGGSAPRAEGPSDPASPPGGENEAAAAAAAIPDAGVATQDAGPSPGAAGAVDAGAEATDAGVESSPEPADAVAQKTGEPARAEPERPARKASRKKVRRRRPRRRPQPRRPAPRKSRRGGDDLLGAARSPGPSGLPKTLDESDVLGVLRRHAGEVRDCVAKQRRADASVQGKMLVKMLIAGSGKPVRVSVSPARFRDAVVGRCVTSAARSWRFPKFASATFPVDFPIVVQ